MRIPNSTFGLLTVSIVVLLVQPVVSPYLNQYLPSFSEYFSGAGNGTIAQMHFQAEAGVTVVKYGIYPIHLPSGLWLVYLWQILLILAAISFPLAIFRGRRRKTSLKTSLVSPVVVQPEKVKPQRLKPVSSPTVAPESYLSSVFKSMGWKENPNEEKPT